MSDPGLNLTPCFWTPVWVDTKVPDIGRGLGASLCSSSGAGLKYQIFRASVMVLGNIFRGSNFKIFFVSLLL